MHVDLTQVINMALVAATMVLIVIVTRSWFAGTFSFFSSKPNQFNLDLEKIQKIIEEKDAGVSVWDLFQRGSITPSEIAAGLCIWFNPGLGRSPEDAYIYASEKLGTSVQQIRRFEIDNAELMAKYTSILKAQLLNLGLN